MVERAASFDAFLLCGIFFTLIGLWGVRNKQLPGRATITPVIALKVSRYFLGAGLLWLLTFLISWLDPQVAALLCLPAVAFFAYGGILIRHTALAEFKNEFRR